MNFRSYTGADIVQVARQQGMLAKRELTAVANERRQAQLARKRLDKELDDAWSVLAEAIVPSLDQSVLDDRAARLGLLTIAAAPVRERYNAYVQQQQQTLATLEQDELWTRRDELDNAAQIRIAEIDDAVTPLRQSVDLLEAEPYFAELVRVGWDSEGYLGRFWQLSYYRHWKYADLIVEQHGARLKCERFRDIADKYREESTALRGLLDSRRLEERQRKAIVDRKERHAQAESNLANAPQRVLVAVRAAVKAHLMPLAFDDITPLVAGDQAAEVALKRVVGVGKKREYLDAMEEHWLKPTQASLERLTQKAGRAEIKYARAKNYSRRFNTDVDKMFPSKSASWLKRRQRFAQARDRMLAFDAWDRAYLADDFLWWNLFFQDRYDGSFIPEVARLRDRQAAYQQGVDDEYARNAAAAVAQAQLDRDDDLVGSDIS